MKADVSENMGVVLPCPICDDRTWQPDTPRAWRWLYYHLRRVHGELASAQLTQRAMANYLAARDADSPKT